MKPHKTFSFKAAGTSNVTPEQLATINKFALEPLTVEQVHVRKYLMAHNGIDRDVERFTESLLDDYARTLPGKGFFVEGHPSSWSGSGGPGKGRFFAAYTEEMTPEAFKALTNEEIRLPEGVTTAKVVWGEAYLLRLDSNKDTIANIDGGVYSFVSIGFKAPYFDVTDERGNFRYGEYRPKGEALEGSLVWLGAQPGATAHKAFDPEPPEHRSQEDHTSRTGGNGIMKEFIEKLKKAFSGKIFTEEGLLEEIKGLIAEKEDRIKVLEPEAADGRAYRKSLIDDAVQFGALLGDIGTDAEAQKKEADFMATWPIDRLKSQRDRYEKQAREKFPTDPTFKGKDETDRQRQAQAAPKATGKKDYTTSEHNELFATIGK